MVLGTNLNCSESAAADGSRTPSTRWRRLPPGASERDDLVDVELPTAGPGRRRLAREPSSGHPPFPFGGEDHAAHEFRRHLARTPGHDRVGAGLPPGIA